jgi:hypothetical protein
MNKKNLATIASIALAILIITPPTWGSILINDISCAFDGSDQEKVSIESNIIEGAANFLKAKAQIDMLLYEYEISSNRIFSSQSALIYTKEAIEFLKTAKTKYLRANDLGKQLGYNENKKVLFQTFQFDLYIAERNLNVSLADKAKTYLTKMDIVGIYNAKIEYIDNILIKLQMIEKTIKNNQKPDIRIMWSLLQQCYEAALFGNYATMIGGYILSGSDGPPICPTNS